MSIPSTHSLWITIRHLGLHEETPPYEVRNTRLVTYICLTSMAVTTFYGTLFALMGDWTSAAIDLAMAGFFSSPLIALSQLRTGLAKALLIVGVNLGTLIVIVVYGDQYSNEMFFVLTAMLGGIVFKERRWGLLGFATAMAFYGISILCTRHIDPLVHTDPAFIAPLHIIGLISVAAVAYVLMEYIRKETSHYEDRILDAKTSLEQQKRSALDSLHYAASIQKAIFGRKDAILRDFDDGFILFKPKDFVSGDFFWSGKADGIQIVAAADCTGHGVPAALMTIMGHDLLNSIVFQQHITDTQEILRTLDSKVTEKLNLDSSDDLQDGMDIAIIAIHQGGQAIQFSGAKSALHLLQNGNMTTIKGSRHAVGSTLYTKAKEFPSTIVQYEPGDRAYLFTDGFEDQFGGPKNKKYMRRRFRDLLCQTSGHTLSAQKAALEAEFNAWKGKEEQTDDVLVIGLQL